jgi:hypothetical protein
MVSLTFEEFAEFIREFTGVSPKTQITAETRFEDDLRITGDDGNDLLERVMNFDA